MGEEKSTFPPGEGMAASPQGGGKGREEDLGGNIDEICDGVL